MIKKFHAGIYHNQKHVSGSLRPVRQEIKKGRLITSHRSTTYSCCLPALGGFSRSWSCKTCRGKDRESRGQCRKGLRYGRLVQKRVERGWLIRGRKPEIARLKARGSFISACKTRYLGI